ncbi:MAG: hypothetical protein JWP12_2263 [Bacteroidetes bacterium]|nr:hypothetical protein [Bacteroidota bacterium]
MQNCAVCHSLGKDKISGPGLAGVTTRIPSETWLRKFIVNNMAVIASGDPYANKIYNENNKALMTVFTTLSDEQVTDVISYIKNASPGTNFNGINPAKIKTIWNKTFQNTLLSTREFEARLPFIFNTCNEKVLDLYVNNLDKNLSGIDLLAYSTSTNPRFLQFAAQGDGKVKNGNKNVELLKKYYEKKSKLFTDAITKTKEEFWKKNAEANSLAGKKGMEHSMKEVERLSDNFTKEFDLNLNEACRQLGYGQLHTTVNSWNALPAQTYGTPITFTGWCNIDAYTAYATANRSTIDYTDPISGKKAIIKYEPLTVTIANFQNYDRVLVYLLPDELNSFMRVNNKNEVFEEKLNELISYKMVCVAYKGTESFYYSQDNVKPGNVAVSLIKSTNRDIENNVSKLSSRKQSKAMNDELNYMEFEKQESKRQAQLVKIQELTNKVRPVILPCMAAKPVPGPAPVDEEIHSKKGGKKLSGIGKK